MSWSSKEGCHSVLPHLLPVNNNNAQWLLVLPPHYPCRHSAYSSLSRENKMPEVCLFNITSVMFLKWTQVQTRNPLQGNSDFIYSINTKCRYIKCAGRDCGEGFRAGPHTRLSSQNSSPLSSAATHTSTHFTTLRSRDSWVYGDRSREDLYTQRPQLARGSETNTWIQITSDG